ncbi:MAG: enolase C-terminal domain-like protein, partial [Candidatus Rokuibacteriota bacterium]
TLRRVAAPLAALGVELIEQPLPADRDEALRGRDWGIRLCADESCRAGDLERLCGLYDLVNVKLDKTGGLSGALALVHEARGRGFGVMLGCMVATSLAMAPAALLASLADYVDLDGPLLLARDRPHGLVFEGSRLHPPARELWG